MQSPTYLNDLINIIEDDKKEVMTPLFVFTTSDQDLKSEDDIQRALKIYKLKRLMKAQENRNE